MIATRTVFRNTISVVGSNVVRLSSRAAARQLPKPITLVLNFTLPDATTICCNNLKNCFVQTEAAASRVKELMDGKEDVVGLRIGVKRRTYFNSYLLACSILVYSFSTTGGCSGYSYNMNYVKSGDEVIEKDELVQMHGVNVYVDPKAIFFIVGTEMDYVVRDFFLDAALALYFH